MRNHQSYSAQPPLSIPSSLVKADPGFGPDRASDADRDRVIDHLNKQHTAGRLTTEEREVRAEMALKATTLAQLTGIYSDLPALTVPSAARRPSRLHASAPTLRRLALSYLGGLLTLVLPAAVLISLNWQGTPPLVVAAGWLAICVGALWTGGNIAWSFVIGCNSSNY